MATSDSFELISTRRDALPILHTRGTHYEVGYDVGRTFRGIIEDFLKSFKHLNEVLIPSYNKPEGKIAFDEAMKVLKENFPQYLQEVKGTADGAKVPFVHLMLLHLDTQVTSPFGNKSCNPIGCSSVCTNYKNQVLLGHTEDNLSEMLNHAYLVNADIIEDQPQGRYGTRREKFTALCYAGYLPGYCMAFNHHGLVYSINVLFAKQVQIRKTSPYFITRALLAASNLEEAEKILRDKGVGVADGISVNMFFNFEDGSSTFHNAEIGPSADDDESQFSLLALEKEKHYMHTNKYLRLKVPEDIDIDGGSSDHRHARAAECPAPKCKDSLLNLLSDSEDKQFPIFRDNAKDHVVTITVGVFDILKKSWTFWMKNPKNYEPLFSLPLHFKWN